MFKKSRIREGVVIFIKYPEPETSDPIFHEKLGEKGTARMQLLMIENILLQVSELRHIKPDLQILVYYDGGDEKLMNYWLARKYQSSKLLIRPQKGEDHGEKLMNAFIDCFHDGIERTVILGANQPGIRDTILEDAFGMLKWDDCDMVLGPAENGSYYLIGANRRVGVHIVESLFKAIEWGTKKVFDQQVEAAGFVGVRMGKLEQTLKGVSDPEDIGIFEQEVGIRSVELTRPMWSIIIPVCNNADSIQGCLENIVQHCSDLTRLQVVVCDGGSTDGTVEKVKETMTDKGVEWKIIHTPSGRGRQMIAGASESSGDNLLFLHVETRLPENYDVMAEDCLWLPGNVAGAFRFGVATPEEEEPPEDSEAQSDMPRSASRLTKLQLKMMEWGTNLRTKYGELPYGDQAIFLRKKMYLYVGGMPGYLVGEDFALVEKLKEFGHIGIVSESPCLTSSTKWEKEGYFKSTGMNTILVAAYKFGVSPEKLASWYHKRKERKHSANIGEDFNSDERLSVTPTTSEAAELIEQVETPPY